MDNMNFEPRKESPKTPEHGHNLLNLDAIETERLKQRIEKWKGLVRMFIHPMYEKWRTREEKYVNDPENVKLIQIEKMLEKFLAMPETKTPPIIIMEEAVYIKKLQDWLKKNSHGTSQDGIYIVNTHTNNPFPDLKNKNEKEAWAILSKKLADLGVRKILMAGMQFEVSTYFTDWTRKSPYMGRCIGIAMSHLSKDKAGKFDIELSGLVHPIHERMYFANLKKE